MQHKHAYLMMLYAQDAMETDKPWERWEFRHKNNNPTSWQYFNSTTSPGWLDNVEYRRKPQTININGFEVPEPVRVALKYEQEYYSVSDFMRADDCTPYQWEGDEVDFRFLKCGLIHLTKEAAEQHANALLSFTKKNEEDA